ncbi:cation transporter, partial [Roseomonas sp. NAR14]
MDDANRRQWRVAGMDCASCVAKVTRAVERLPGVSAVEVNLMAERLALDLAPDASAETVERQVAALGYTATPLPAGDRRRDGHGHAAPGRAHDRAHDRAGHDHTGHDHTGHDHAGHDHAGRDREAHDHAAHDHAGHDHAGHDHAGHDHGGGQGIAHSHGGHEDDPADAGKPWWRTGKAMLVWTLGGLVGAAYLLSLALPAAHQWLFVAATLVALLPFGRRAVALARAGSPFSIETLMCVAALGALVIGAAEEAAIVVLLFALGELLENVAAGRARAGIRALARLMPRTALRLGPDGAAETVPSERLR